MNAAVIQFPEVASITSDLSQRPAAMIPVSKRGIKIWRHKKISHSDLLTALGKSSLPDLPFSEIQQLVEDISDFAREIDHRLNQTDVCYRVSLVK
jgi:hypothetical protein